jgi:hypothetical protein
MRLALETNQGFFTPTLQLTRFLQLAAGSHTL